MEFATLNHLVNFLFFVVWFVFNLVLVFAIYLAARDRVSASAKKWIQGQLARYGQFVIKTIVMPNWPGPAFDLYRFPSLVGGVSLASLLWLGIRLTI